MLLMWLLGGKSSVTWDLKEQDATPPRAGCDTFFGHSASPFPYTF